MDIKDTLIENTVLNLKKLLSDSLCCIILVGSSVWSGNLDCVDDIDFEVVINLNKLNLENTTKDNDFGDLINALMVYKKNFTSFKLDYLSYKYIFQKRKISLHFLNKENFSSICNTNLLRIRTTRYLRELRIHPKDKPPIYIQRSFDNKRIEFQIQVRRTKIGYISLTPLVVYNENLFYMGLLHDKFLSEKILYCRDIECVKAISILHSHVCKMFERELTKNKNIRFIN